MLFIALISASVVATVSPAAHAAALRPVVVPGAAAQLTPGAADVPTRLPLYPRCRQAADLPSSALDVDRGTDDGPASLAMPAVTTALGAYRIVRVVGNDPGPALRARLYQSHCAYRL